MEPELSFGNRWKSGNSPAPSSLQTSDCVIGHKNDNYLEGPPSRHSGRREDRKKDQNHYMSTQPTIGLNDGNVIPQLGFGVWQVPNEEAAKVVGTAISTGYRSIDTATIYGNEIGVGKAIAASPVRRAQLFITTKLWNDQHTNARSAVNESLRRLGLDHVDLYLIHWPKPRQNAYVEAWKALVKLKEEGRAKSVGVSNFTVSHLKRIIDDGCSTISQPD
jgi:2,5-diketo-D-gluconate reductase A